MIDSFEGEYRFLSNFAASPFKDIGCAIVYPTVEHFYQAAKTDNRADKYDIISTESPGKAKKLGQEVILRDDWDEIKISIMRKALKLKFDQNPELRKKLVETYGRKLVEGNWWGDTFWGVDDGVGENNLGKLLMELRARYVNEEKEFEDFDPNYLENIEKAMANDDREDDEDDLNAAIMTHYD